MIYYASGKLLLFGEYLVLKGAECLAIPLKYGQKLTVEESADNFLKWTSTINSDAWFSTKFSTNLDILNTSDQQKAEALKNVLAVIKLERPELFKTGLDIKINADFSLEWGFGSSSTLISCLSQWSGIDPFTLLKQTFGGSGYDIACATAKSPILYENDTHQSVPVYLFPKVTSKLLFVYSGKKQQSSGEVNRFNSIGITTDEIKKMDSIVLSAIKATQIQNFEDCILKSENLLSGILKMKPIKESQFNDYPFSIKSLGAWGGDFFMATFRKENEARNYFAQAGFPIQFNFNEIIKK
jgi:mevalonate kinase